jgi:hypothetical protein
MSFLGAGMGDLLPNTKEEEKRKLVATKESKITAS